MKTRWLMLCLLGLDCTGAAGQEFVSLPERVSEITDPVMGIPVRVWISPFAAGTREVTQRQYREVTGSNPSAHPGDDFPVENVTWWDAIRYCNLRSAREGLQPCYDLTTGRCDRSRNGYRLLTDAEWTYAAGTARAGHLGSVDTKDSGALAEFARTHSTHPVGALAANDQGLYDTAGNVWEWVQDYQDPTGGVHSALNPSGPQIGVARVMRGGSYLTTTSSWGRQLRSSLEPERRSPYTGFRIGRSIPDVQRTYSAEWGAPYQQIPPGMVGQTAGLVWGGDRAAIREKWAGITGRVSLPASGKPSVRRVAVHVEPAFTGELLYLQVEPEHWEKIYVMLPAGADASRPLPVVIVPYYDVDAPAGKPMGGRRSEPPGVRSLGLAAVQQGMAAVAIRWFGESYGENLAEVVTTLKARHPGVTGMGKWVWDARRLVDYLETRPEFDAKRIGMIGHSLGGKLTLYAAAMDDRIRVAVASEPGIGLSFSNYDDFWYLGEAVKRLDTSTDQHELLGLMAPRAFLLIGGDSADNDRSWHYINAARPAYAQAGVADRIGYVNHRKGHSPTPESVRLAMEWLSRYLNE